MKPLATFLFILIASASFAQEFQSGVLSSPGAAPFKFNTTIIVTDSAFVTKTSGHPETVKKITSKTDNVLYVTDGTAVDKVTIMPAPGKMKGFVYSHIITIDTDNRFDGKQLTYYCQKK